MLVKSKARSTALASAVKIDESSGIRCIWLSDITAQPTFEFSFDPSHWVGAKVQVTRCVDLYSGQILVFSMTLMTVCVLSAV